VNIEDRIKWSTEKTELLAVKKSLLAQADGLRAELDAERQRTEQERKGRSEENRQYHDLIDQTRAQFAHKVSEHDAVVQRLRERISELEGKNKELEARPAGVREKPEDAEARRKLEEKLGQQADVISQKDERIRSLEAEKQEIDSKMMGLLMDARSLERLEKELSSVSQLAQNTSQNIPGEKVSPRPVSPPKAKTGSPSTPKTPPTKDRKDKKESFWQRLIQPFSPTSVSIRLDKKQ
jgi:chromosome segregation ATPase